MTKIGRVGAATLAGAIVSAAAAQDAVQWRVEDGGNGHWYRLQTSGAIATFEAALSFAQSLGGSFLTASTSAEWEFITQNVLEILPPGHYVTLGISQDPAASEPFEGWAWIDGSTFRIPWATGSPDETLPDEDWAHAFRHADGVFRANDCISIINDPSYPFFISVEWSADCNGDGIVDYGQILDGTFADTNGNGVPDCCDGLEPCLGDLNGDDSVGPPDLGVLLAIWGTDGGKIGGADLNGDGTVNAADLGLLIGAWGDCGCR